MKRLEKQLFLFLLLLAGVIYGQFGGDPGIDPGGSGFGGGIELIPITGATNVDLNSTHIYTVTALGGDQPSRGSWEVPGATIISSSATRATIKWTSVGSKEMTYRGSLGTRNFLSPYFVTVNALPVAPPAPSVPTISLNNCGNMVLSRATPPSGITWYWQGTNGNGTSTLNSGGTYPLSLSGRYYLRARNSSGLWSAASSSIQVSVKTIPSVPPTASVVNNCGSSVLTKGSQPSGITFYWQSSASGTSTSNSATSLTRTSGSVYYLRARNNSSGCWSWARSVSYSIKTVPSVPPTASVVNNCGSSVLTKGSQPSGITFYWQSSASGTSTSNSATSLTRTSGSIYYLRARNNSTGCWSSARSVGYSIKTIPSVPPTASVVNNCGSSVLTKGSQPSGITFYWQSSAGGTSTSNSATSLTRTSGSVYYLRARNNSTGCWSSSRTVSYSVNAVPSVPAAATVVNNCGSSVLTKVSQPSGITFYWQSSAGGTSTSNSATSLSRTSGSVYYLRARNNNSGCWGSARTVNYTIQQPSTWYADTDGDGYGNSTSTTSACSKPSGYVANSSDYNDGTANITNIAPQTFYLDADNDGFGDPNTSVYYSVKPSGYVTNNTDACPNTAGANNGCNYTAPVFSNENYVFTRGYRKAMTSPSGITDASDVVESIVYFDGLGRAKQSIGIRQGTSGKDIVTHMEYDAFGRQTKEYLPYVTTSQNGLISTGDIATATKTYYQTAYSEDFAGVPLPAINAYSEKVLESSPLNRVFEQAAPGKDWAKGSSFSSKGYTNNSHSIKFEYNANEANEVKIFGVTTTYTNKTYTPSLTGGAMFYPAAVLYKTITKDENWELADGVNHTTEEFKNKQGQVILKRTYNNSQKHDTYYVYDDLGNLSYVLPPKIDGSIATLSSINSKLNDLGYQYKYDYRNRLVEKRIPGKDWEYIVYDDLDKPVLTQDANLRAQNKWLYTKYDALGRVVYTGVYVNNRTRETMTTLLFGRNPLLHNDSRSTTGFSDAGATVYYNNAGFPTDTAKMDVYTINYYDTYVDLPVGLNPTVTTSYGVTSTATTKGLATVSKVRVLGANNWITTVTYYDEKARPIYVYSKNDELETIDILESNLDDFTGKVLETKATHKKTGKADIVTVDKFTYDNLDRITKQTQTIGGTTEVIAENSYDELGQLTEKKVGGKTNQSRLQTVNYTYNVRGWLKNINQDANNDNDLFNFTLAYNTPTSGEALYNGNISQTSWNTLSTDTSSKTYTYSYDALNRITAGIDNTGRYNLNSVGYDKNGNITSLSRNGHLNIGATNFGLMDDLSYSYDNGNKLMKIVDNAPIDGFGFKDDAVNTTADTSNDYTYDANGNMLTDTNKGIISNIQYNYLNLPTQINVGGQVINYTYDATGTKLKKVTNGVTTEYAGNYRYVEGVLKDFKHPEGYVKKDGNIFNYVYSYKDHLGNVRLNYADFNNNGSIEAATEILDEKNYYPFGGTHEGYNTNVNGAYYPFGYNGKEESDENGLATLDFGARNYDKWTGRWMNLDPLAEQMRRHSPYNYAFNNPVYFIDPDGMAPVSNDWIDNGDGTYTAEAGDSASTLHTQYLGGLGYSFEQVDNLVQSQHGDNIVNPVDDIEDSNLEVDDVVDIIPAEDRAFVKAHNEDSKKELGSEVSANKKTMDSKEKENDSLKNVKDQRNENMSKQIESKVFNGEAWDRGADKALKASQLVKLTIISMQNNRIDKKITKNKNTIDSLKKANQSKKEEIKRRSNN